MRLIKHILYINIVNYITGEECMGHDLSKFRCTFCNNLWK